MPRSNKNWDDLGEWGASKAKKMVKEAKTKAALAFLESVTLPTNQNPASDNYNNGVTPVDTGNLIANTEVGIGSPQDGLNGSTDPSGKSTYFDGMFKINSADSWDKVFITNSTQYNKQAEYTGWARTGAYRYWSISYNNMLESIGVD
jgi:hypothetical protein